MTGKAHMYISAFLCQCFALLVYRDFSPAPLVIGAIFGLLADIDTDQSKISYLLIKKFGGSKRIAGVNHYKTDVRYNARVEKARRCALSVVLVFGGLVLTFISRKNIYFLFGCLYTAFLPWTKHRTLSHTLLSSIIIGVCATLSFRLYGLTNYGVYCGVGYFLHIFEDSFTKSGTPLFFPFSKKKFKIPLMSTGTTKGAMVELAFGCISFTLCVITYFFAAFH